jgi:hypothetical protein
MTFQDYKSCFNFTLDQFLAQNNLGESQVQNDLRYEKIKDVSRVTLGNRQFFFFKENQLRLIYISDDAATKQLWKEFKDTTNMASPDDTIRSRAGKTSNQVVFATSGLTASFTKDDVDFIEIYRPCTLQEYLEKIYQEPPPFIM